MLQIAICDDEAEDLKRISHLAAAYAEAHPELNIACSQFLSPCNLLEMLEKTDILTSICSISSCRSWTG